MMNPPKFKSHKKNPQKLRNNLVYLLSLVYYKTVQSCDGKLENIDPQKYHRLCTEYIKPIIHNYKQYISWLLDRGIIEDERSWSKNIKCNGYRFNQKYTNGIFKPRQEIIYDKTIWDKLKTFRVPERVEQQYDYLYKWFNHLDIDFTKAESILDEIKSNNKDYHLTRLYNILLPDLHRFSIGETNRLYSPITNLKKQLRACLLVDGSNLTEVDIKSSIPMISTFLFDHNFLNKITDILKLLYIDIGPNTTEYNPYIMWLKKGKEVLVDPSESDIQQYIEDVRNGDIYVKLQDKWNKDLGTNYTRNTAKKKFLSILNSPKYLESREKEILTSLYPSVLSFVDGLNGWFKTNVNKSRTKDEIAPFAYLTQMIESRFVLDIVCRRISDEYPHAPIFTIHDSILTTKPNRGLVLEIMKEESLNFFGIEISV